MLVKAIEKKTRGYNTLKLHDGEEVHVNVNSVAFVRPDRNEALLNVGVWMYLDDESCEKLAQRLR